MSDSDEILRLRERMHLWDKWGARMDQRVKLVERIVYGAVALMLATQLAALVALVTRLPH